MGIRFRVGPVGRGRSAVQKKNERRGGLCGLVGSGLVGCCYCYLGQVGKGLHIFQLFQYFSSVWGENRSRNRRPKYAELKTEAEPKNRKNRHFGSVRFSVFGEKMPTPTYRSGEVALHNDDVSSRP
jgi:hypothetical protein